MKEGLKWMKLVDLARELDLYMEVTKSKGGDIHHEREDKKRGTKSFRPSSETIREKSLKLSRREYWAP